MTNQPQSKAAFAVFLSTARGRIITALTIVALLLGIAAEGVSLVTGYYNMVIARQKSEAATARGATPAAVHPTLPDDPPAGYCNAGETTDACRTRFLRSLLSGF
ncbi:MAG: hypothetical protein ACLP7P_02360 [Rhodomicrobium sp.]